MRSEEAAGRILDAIEAGKAADLERVLTERFEDETADSGEAERCELVEAIRKDFGILFGRLPVDQGAIRARLELLAHLAGRRPDYLSSFRIEASSSRTSRSSAGGAENRSGSWRREARLGWAGLLRSSR